MAEPRKRPATYEDLVALPEGVKGEIIDGELYTSPRPRSGHAHVAKTLGGEFYGPFERGRGGPGGWWIFVEPGIELPRSPEFSPDVAGWRKERMPARPPSDQPIRQVPDWACEILSPSTRSYDMLVKRRFYAEIGVAWLWYVDPEARTLSAYRLHEGHWLELGVWGNDERVRVEPFVEVELDLAYWWDPTREPG